MKGERIQPLTHRLSRYVRPSQEGAVTRLKRSRLAFVLFLVVLLALFIMLTHTPWRHSLLFPGPLSSQHANQQEQCISCHVRANNPVMSWLWHTMQPLTAEQQSEGCMSCHSHKHQKGVVAHGLDQQAIRSLMPTDIDKQQVDQHLTQLTNRKPLGCFHCHTEHQGAEGELIKLSDAECDSCHLQSQQNFANQHSDFSLSRQTGISFDHDRHQSIFAEQGDTLQCQQCHGKGPKPVFPKFDQQCLNCHEETIEKPVELLALPRVNIKTPGIGEWPKQRGKKKPSVAMQTLLAEYGVPEKPEDKSKQAQLRFQQQMVKGYKQLLMDILQDNMSETQLRKVQGQLMATELFKEADAVRLLLYDAEALIPLLTKLQGQWFPHLFSESLVEEKSKQSKPKKSRKKALKPVQQWGKMGSWQLTRKGAVVVSVNHHARISEIKKIEKQVAKVELTEEESNSGCLLCHQVQNKKVIWQYQPKSPMPTFKFNHQPHLVGQPKTVCLDCHTRPENNDNVEQTTVSAETSTVESQINKQTDWLFSPVTKQPCVSCHKEDKTGESCLLCHNYHFEEAPWIKALP